MCMFNPFLHTLHKRNAKTYATCVNFSTHWIFCARILNTFNTICVSIGKFRSLFALSTEKFTRPPVATNMISAQSLTPSLSHDYPNLTILPWVTQCLFRCYPRPAQRLPQENPRVGEPNPNIAMDWSHHCHLQYRGPIAPSKHPHLGEKVSDFFLFTTPYLGGCPRL